MSAWLIPALGALLVWGVWGALPKLASRYLDPKSILVYEAFGALAVGLVVLAQMNFRPQVHGPGIGLAVATGAAGFVGTLLFLHAISKGKASVVVTITALYPLVVIILSHLFLGEHITLKQGIGMALALVALVLMS